MKIKLYASNGNVVGAEIRPGKPKELPSMQDGWRFNFPKHSKLRNASTYVISTLETPDIIEGCMIFQMKDKIDPYMAFIETAPRHRDSYRKLEGVAGCLIAYACTLSNVLGPGENNGWLTFRVEEKNRVDEIKLMTLYSSKYRAKRLADTTTMFIQPHDGKLLIMEYLEG